MDAAAVALGDPSSAQATGIDPNDVYSNALERWLASGAPDLEDRIPVVLAELGLDLGEKAIDQTLMTSLSGGQAARVGLGVADRRQCRHAQDHLDPPSG